MIESVGPYTLCQQMISTLDAKSINAAHRNKPTMWAYYGEMADWLRDYFGTCRDQGDDGYAGAALALVMRAEEQCPTLPRAEAATLWARCVYARRILSAWTPGDTGPRASLQWLRDRVRIGAAA